MMSSAVCGSDGDLPPIGHLLKRFSAQQGDAIAIVDGDARLSFRQLEQLVCTHAHALQARSIGRGDRVAFLMRDGFALLSYYLACARIGAIAVPLNWRLASPELAGQIQQAAPRLWCVSERFADAATQSGVATDILVIPDTPAESLALFASWKRGDPPEEPDVDQPWFMLFTSGTTGTAKGCLLSQSGQITLAQSLARASVLTSEDVLVMPWPIFHVGGLCVVLSHLVVGSRVVFTPHPLTAEKLYALMVAEGCSCTSFPPTLQADVIQLVEDKGMPARLRLLMTAGTTLVDASTVERLEHVFGNRLIVGYGQTEAGGLALQMSYAEQRTRPQACGKPLPHIKAAIVGEDGQRLPSGEVGELVLQGESVMLGYWQNPTATGETLKDGWLHTGDVFRSDDEGYFHFVARKKELIKTGGENVYPAEVERVLMAHPHINDCIVVGVKDEKWGEAVKAFVVLAPNSALSRKDIEALCRASLAGYKRPRYVEFLDSIPRAWGKVDRRLLAQREITPDQAC